VSAAKIFKSKNIPIDIVVGPITVVLVVVNAKYGCALRTLILIQQLFSEWMCMPVMSYLRAKRWSARPTAHRTHAHYACRRRLTPLASDNIDASASCAVPFRPYSSATVRPRKACRWKLTCTQNNELLFDVDSKLFSYIASIILHSTSGRQPNFVAWTRGTRNGN